MPVDFKKCVVKSLFSLKLSQRFSTFAVNKIFKYVLHLHEVHCCLLIWMFKNALVIRRVVWRTLCPVHTSAAHSPLCVYTSCWSCSVFQQKQKRRCTFHDSAFVLLGTIPACDGQTSRQTDRHVAVAKTRAIA